MQNSENRSTTWRLPHFEKFHTRQLRTIFWLLVPLFLSSCGIEGSITDLTEKISPDFTKPLNRKEPDFLSGQIVTTSGGFQLRAVFGELPENQVSNGYQIMAVINE